MLSISVLFATNLHAEPGVTTTIGTFIETETNNAVWADLNLTVAPGLDLGIRGNETPLYGWIHLENRQVALISSALNYTGQEIRSRLRIGSNLKIGSVDFNPEYELRIKYYAGFSVSELSIFENRFKLNFNIPVSSEWKIFINLMPTLILNINKSRDDTDGQSIFKDYYHEVEIGSGWSWNSDNALLLSIYNELGLDERIRNTGGSINNGNRYYEYEFQFRIIYQHRFNNGIQLSPFTRIGIVRNLLYETSPGVIETVNFRRHRIGVTMNYNAENGITPNLECYYQRSAMGQKPVQHRMYWKVGVDYSF